MDPQQLIRFPDQFPVLFRADGKTVDKGDATDVSLRTLIDAVIIDVGEKYIVFHDLKVKGQGRNMTPCADGHQIGGQFIKVISHKLGSPL